MNPELPENVTEILPQDQIALPPSEAAKITAKVDVWALAMQSALRDGCL